ncbi:M1 family metallopeptidase [Streptomyces sp. NPDC059578]|uniref:M1 family metallopeptidase n=1 Tax=Streptomyces sp. NPDC059578 TaxID=3346874 RepID=UPI00369BFAAE
MGRVDPARTRTRRRCATGARTRARLGLGLAITVLAGCTATGGGLTAGSGGRGAGADGVGDPYFPLMGNGGYDVTHYDLALAYAPKARHLTGTATLTARATADLTAFNLDLLGLTVRSVTVDGASARVARDGQELTVRPRAALARGEEFRTTVRYAGRPRTITDPDGSEEGWLPTADGALALGQPTGSMAWFPGNHHPGDKAAYDIAVTVPEGLTAVSGGELRSTRTVDGRTTFDWHGAEPQASYTATVAIGRYRVGTSRIDADRLTEDDGIKATDGRRELSVYNAVDPQVAAAARKPLSRLPAIMAWAERTFGPYPFSTTGAIVDRDGDAGYALETQTRPVYPGAPDPVLIVHELAHQWYGDSVTPRTWRDMWLNEGFATYAEWLWDEEHGGRTAQSVFDALYRGDYYDEPGADAAVWAFPPAAPPSAADVSQAPVYQRGAMVLHQVRRTVGEGAFREVLRGWPTVHRYGTVDTAAFTAYVERVAPRHRGALRRVWATWLHGEGKPSRP